MKAHVETFGTSFAHPLNQSKAIYLLSFLLPIEVI